MNYWTENTFWECAKDIPISYAIKQSRTLMGIPVSVWLAEIELSGAVDAFYDPKKNKIIPIIEVATRVPEVQKAGNFIKEVG